MLSPASNFGEFLNNRAKIGDAYEFPHKTYQPRISPEVPRIVSSAVAIQPCSVSAVKSGCEAETAVALT